MTQPESDPKYERLVHKLNPQNRLRRTWTLTGGVSAQVTALEIEQPNGQIKKLVVRQHGAVDHQRNPHIARDEFRLLEIVRAAGLPAPTPIAVDESGEIFETPVIVIEYLEGDPLFTPTHVSDCVRQMAAQLAAIHRIDGLSADLAFLPEQRQRYSQTFRVRPARVGDSLDEGRIRDALETVWPLTTYNPAVLLHGDFWPGNLLWKHDQLVGILDWEDASVGDPLEDLANSRLEILWTFGSEAMQTFTEAYRAHSPIQFGHLPYWDLCAALKPAFKIDEWATDKQAARRMRECHRAFVAQAFEKLSDESLS